MSAPIKLKGEKHLWEMVIGLEVHAQVKCKSKPMSISHKCFSPLSLIGALILLFLL